MRTRFAPSPTGYLHLGHAYAAQQAFSFGGECLLRVEDIDFTRCKPAYTDAIFEDLTWLGFKWPEPVRIQSEHLDEYARVIETLRDRGLLYRCFKTRMELPGGLYTGQDRLSEREAQKRAETGEAFAWRLDMHRARTGVQNLTYIELGEDKSKSVKRVQPEQYGDVVLARKDIGTSYLIACTHDDALQDITHVVRGADFIHLTGIQRILQDLMGWPEPTYHHHILLTNANGEKLAKRNKDTAIRELRAQGLSPRDVLGMASPTTTG